LSRARASLQAGRLEAPEGRNALDLFQAVLLVQPDHAEARAGLARTIDLLIDQARHEASTGHKAEAERLLQRVLAAVSGHEAAEALLLELNPPDLPSRQLAREQVAEASTRAAVPPAPPPMNRTGPLPEPVSAAFASRMVPAAPPPPTRATVHSDPLAPRYVNTAPDKRVASWRTQRPPNVPLPPAMPIAGYERPTPTPAQAATISTAKAKAMAAVPADEFDRIAAPDPVYPAQALRAGTRGWVELEFTITPTGGVRDIQVVGAEPTGVFDDAATAALAQWQFRPRLVNGQLVSQRSSITLRFDVDD
jgi:protein TonB